MAHCVYRGVSGCQGQAPSAHSARFEDCCSTTSTIAMSAGRQRRRPQLWKCCKREDCLLFFSSKIFSKFIHWYSVLLTGCFEAKDSLCVLHNPERRFWKLFLFHFHDNINLAIYIMYIITLEVNFGVDIMYIMERACQLRIKNLERIRLNCRDGVAVKMKSLHDHFQFIRVTSFANCFSFLAFRR